MKIWRYIKWLVKQVRMDMRTDVVHYLDKRRSANANKKKQKGLIRQENYRLSIPQADHGVESEIDQ